MSVKIYSTSSCSACKMAKSYLKERQIKFIDYDIGSDSRKAEEMLYKSHQTGVPVIDFNGKIIIGFDRERLDRIVSINKNQR